MTIVIFKLTSVRAEIFGCFFGGCATQKTSFRPNPNGGQIRYNLPMRIEFYGTMRNLTNRTAADLDERQITSVNQVFEWLYQEFPQIRIELLDQEGRLASQIPVYVNGRNPRLRLNGLDEPLQSEDVVCLFSPISSGKINVEVLKQASQKN